MRHIFNDLTKRLGEKILAEKGWTGGEVLHVNLTLDGWTGSDVTPAEIEYPAVVHYIEQGQTKTYTKYYRYLSEIINELEEIREDSWDG